MDPKLKEQLEQLLTELLKNTQDAATWAKGEIPLLIQEKIAFGRAYETVVLAILLAGLILFIWLWKKWYRWGKDDFDDKAIAFFGLIVLSGGFAIVFIGQLHDTLQVWFAPRLYIVEWLMGLVKS